MPYNSTVFTISLASLRLDSHYIVIELKSIAIELWYNIKIICKYDWHCLTLARIVTTFISQDTGGFSVCSSKWEISASEDLKKKIFYTLLETMQQKVWYFYIVSVSFQVPIAVYLTNQEGQ